METFFRTPIFIIYCNRLRFALLKSPLISSRAVGFNNNLIAPAFLGRIERPVGAP